MNAADGLDVELAHVLDVAAHDALEAVLDAEDVDPFEHAANRRRADDAVDARRRTAANQDRELLSLCHARMVALHRQAVKHLFRTRRAWFPDGGRRDGGSRRGRSGTG